MQPTLPEDTRKFLGLGTGERYSSYVRPPSFKPGTNDITDKSAAERTARFQASAEMLFKQDFSKLDDPGASGLYQAVTEGMFGLADTDGKMAFGKRASVDPRQNLELLRRFVKGEYNLIEDPEYTKWREMDEEAKFRYALENETKTNKTKSYLKGERGAGPGEQLAGGLAISIPGLPAGTAALVTPSHIREQNMQVYNESVRRSNYDSLTDEEKKAYRADVIGDYEEKLSRNQTLATYLQFAGNLSDKAAYYLAKSFKNGVPDENIEFLDEEERDRVYSAFSLMRGDKKRGRIIGIGTDFTDNTAVNRAQLMFYGLQQSVVGLVSDTVDFARDAAMWTYAKTALDDAERKAFFEGWDASVRAERAMEQALPEAEGWWGAGLQGLAENVHWFIPYGAIGKGGKMMGAANKTLGRAKLQKEILTGAKTLAEANAKASSARLLADVTGAVKAGKGAKKISEFQSAIAMRRELAAVDRYTKALQEIPAIEKAAKMRDIGGASMWAVGEASALSAFASEYVVAADAAGVSREESVLTAALVGLVNAKIEHLYVAGLESSLTPVEIKALTFKALLNAVKSDGSKGFRKWFVNRVQRGVVEGAKVTATEGLIEEPLQQLATEHGIAFDKLCAELREKGETDLADKFVVFGQSFAKQLPEDFGIFIDTVCDTMPTSLAFGATTIGNMTRRQHLHNVLTRHAARRAGSTSTMLTAQNGNELMQAVDYDAGLVDMIQQAVNIRSAVERHWQDTDGEDEAKSKNPNRFGEAITAARRVYRNPKTRDAVQEIAEVAGVDIKTAEVMAQYLQTEAEATAFSPQARAFTSLNQSLADIDEETIKTVLPGYVEGSFAADTENGIYSGRVKLGDGTERTIAYRVGDLSAELTEMASANAALDSSFGKSFNARHAELGDGITWEGLSDAQRYMEALRSAASVNGFSSGKSGVFELTDAKGEKVRVNADDIIYLANGRLGDVGYGPAATMGTARHETWHSLWHFARATMDEADVQTLAKVLGVDVTKDGWEIDLDEAMAHQLERYASGHYVAHAVSSRFDKMLNGWAGNVIKFFGSYGPADEVKDPKTGKSFALKDFYDKVLRGELGSGKLGVELRSIPAAEKPGEGAAVSAGVMPVEVTDEERAAEEQAMLAGEGEARGEGKGQGEAQKPTPTPSPSPAATTTATTTTTPPTAYTAENPADALVPNARYYKIGLPNSEVKLVGRLEVRDVETGVITSTDEDYHDRGNQNRDDKSEESRGLVMKIAGRPDPLQVGTVQPIANNGIIWALPNGDIIIGNHRVNGVRAGYEKGTAGDLEKFVREDAAKRGIEIGENVKKPLMVFVLERIEAPEGQKVPDVHEVVRLANESQNRGFNVREQAGNDAKILIDNHLLPRMAFRADGRIDETKSADAIGKFRQESGAQGLVGEDGMLTEEGQTRIQNAALAALLGGTGNAALLQRIMERSGTLDMASQVRALMKMTPDLMALAETKSAFDLRGAIGEALELFTEWREADEEKRVEKGKSRHDWRETGKDGKRIRGLSWEAFMAQGDMFRKPSDEAQILGDLFARTEELRSFDREDVESAAGKKRVIDLISGYLADYIANARAVNTETDDMFGAPPASRADVLQAQRTRGENGARFSVSAAEDAAYLDAVKRGDKETYTRLLREVAARRGYTKPDYFDAHSAPSPAYVEGGKENFRNLEELRRVHEEDGGDLNLFAIANGISSVPEDFFTRQGLRWYGQDAYGWAAQESLNALRPAIDDIRRQMDEYGEVKDMPKVKIYRAVPKSVEEGSLQSEGQWVSPSKAYAVDHGEHRFGEGEYRIIEQSVGADELWFDGNAITEWGFDDGTENVYKNTKNNRKLFEPTYDDNGNLIPLSQRFNQEKSDIRFSISLSAVTLDEAKAKIAAQKGVPFRNYFTDLEVTLSSSAEGKLVSKKAAMKSVKNGFTFEQHNAMAANVGELFERGFEAVIRGDKEGDANIKSIRRYACPVSFEGKKAFAWITVKESKQHGAKIYSVESIELEAFSRKVEEELILAPHALNAPTPQIIPQGGSAAQARFSIGGIYTGSAADYEKPSLHYVGKSNGVAFGWGLYGSSTKSDAENFGGNVYGQTFFMNRPEGDESHLIEWEKPLTDENKERILDGLTYQARHNPNVKNAVEKTIAEEDRDFGRDQEEDYEPPEVEGMADDILREAIERTIDVQTDSGKSVYTHLAALLTGKSLGEVNSFAGRTEAFKAASEFLRDECDIDGIKYPAEFDGAKRGETHYVSFRDDNIRVDHKWVDGQMRFSISKDVVSDEDFTAPSRDITLPSLPSELDYAIGGNGRNVLIKKNIFEKNLSAHPEITPEESRNILDLALYHATLVGQSQPKKREHYWVAVNRGDGKNATVVVDVYPTKENIEVVGWRSINDRGLEKIKRQAEREDGQLLILSPDNGSAAALSALASNLPSTPRIIPQGGSAAQARFSIGGIRGAEKLGIGNVAEAEKMEKDGASREDIWRKTGWWRAKDGKWRVELPDVPNVFLPLSNSERKKLSSLRNKEAKTRNAYFKAKSDGANGDELKRLEQEFKKATLNPELSLLETRGREWHETLLGNLLGDHPILDAYPFLKEMWVALQDLPEHEHGFHVTGKNEISINSRLSPEERHATLVHEIQHAIQEHEGFARGGSPESAAELVKEMRRKEKVWSYKLEVEEMAKKLNTSNPYEIEKAIFDLFGAKNREDVINLEKEGWIPDQAGRDKGYNLYARGYDKEGYEDAWNEYLGKMRENNSVLWWDGTPHELYRRLAGEVEARNAQKRLNMLPLERAAIPPWQTEDVPENRQIVRFSLSSELMGVMQRNAEKVADQLSVKELVGTDKGVYVAKIDTGNPKTSDGKNTVIVRRGLSDTLHLIQMQRPVRVVAPVPEFVSNEQVKYTPEQRKAAFEFVVEKAKSQYGEVENRDFGEFRIDSLFKDEVQRHAIARKCDMEAVCAAKEIAQRMVHFAASPNEEVGRKNGIKYFEYGLARVSLSDGDYLVMGEVGEKANSAKYYDQRVVAKLKADFKVSPKQGPAQIEKSAFDAVYDSRFRILMQAVGEAHNEKPRYSTAPGATTETSGLFPSLQSMSDDELVTAAVAVRMALGDTAKLSDRAVKINTVNNIVRRLHPEWGSSDVGRESLRVLSDARKFAKKIREDLDRGVSDSLVLEHLPQTAREQFGREMMEEARKGQRLGRFGQKVAAKLEERQTRIVEDAVRIQTGIDVSLMENTYGINLSETLMHLTENPLREKPPAGAGATEGGEAIDGEDGVGEEVPAVDVGEAVKKAVADIIAASSVATAANEKNRADRRAAAARDKEREAELGGEEAPTEGMGGDDFGGDVVALATKKAGLDLENPRHLAEFVAEFTRRYWIKEHQLALDAEVWRDLVAVQFLRKTAQSIYAKLCKDLTYSRSRETAMQHIAKLDNVPTVQGLLSEMEFVGALINAQRIRETQKAMCEKLDLFLRQKFGAQGRFKPDKEEGKRNVSAEAELRARYMRHAMWLTPDAAAEEARTLQETLDALSVDFKDAGRDVDQSREFIETIRKLNVLREFGALRYKPIGEIEAAAQWWEDFERGEADDIVREMSDRDIRTKKAANLLAVAFADPSRKVMRGEGKLEKLNEYITGHMGFVALLNDCMRHASDADRAAVKDIVGYIAREIQKAGDGASAEKRRNNDAFHAAVEAIYAKKFNAVMADMMAVDERFMEFMGETGGVKVPPTKARAMQLLVSLLQEGRKVEVEDEENPGQMKFVWEGGYHDNIVKHKREGQAEKIMKLLTPADMNMVKWLGMWYEQNRQDLSIVCHKLFGIGVYAELPNYFPVKMLLEKQGLEKGEAVGWTIFPKALTPRVRNERDFDTSADIFQMWAARMEEAAQWKHHAQLGLEMRGIFGRSELQAAVIAHHGAQANALMQGFITDILASKGTIDRTMAGTQYFSDKVRGWTALCALGGNVGVLLKQTTSIPAFGFEIGLVNTAKHLVSAFTPDGLQAMSAIWNSEQRKTRWDVGNSEAVANALNKKDAGWLKRAFQASMITNKIGDAIPGLVIGQGIYRDCLERGMSPADAMAETWMIIERTQQSSRMENLASMQRRSRLGRTMFQFLSTQRQYLDYEMRAIREVIANPKSAGRWGNLGRTLLLNHFILTSLYYWMGQLYKAMLGQEPPEDELTDWIITCLLGPYGSMFVAGFMCKATLERALKGYSFGGGSSMLPMESWLTNQINDAGRLVEAIFSAEDSTWDEMVDAAGKWMSDFNSTFRDLRKIYRFRRQEEK